MDRAVVWPVVISRHRHVVAALFLGACASGEVEPSRDGSGDAREIGVVDLAADMARDSGPPDAPRDGPMADLRRDAGADLGVDQGADGPPPDVVDLPNVGARCTSDGDCRGGTRCALSLGGGVQICTMNCTPDDPATTGNEDSCPDLARDVCGEVPLTSGSSQNFCLQRCTPRDDGNDCPAGIACDPSSTTISGQLGLAVCVAVACTSDEDCPVTLPTACDPSTGSGCDAGADEVCVGVTAGIGRCAVAGVCQQLSGLCGGHTLGTPGAAVGDPCEGDTDCGNGMSCLVERTVDGRVRFRNGMCTKAGCGFVGLASASCPTGSTCNNLYPGGLCQHSCALTVASDCRGHAGDRLGDYECAAWNNFTLGGRPVTSGPVCDQPTACDLVSCEALGLAANPTAMGCRDPATDAIVPSDTPGAFCLDQTASGPLPQ